MNVYVAPAAQGGSDSNPCTLAQPCLTPQHATAMVQGMPGGAHVVMFRGGDYLLTSTWTLGSADSGTATTNIVYQNYGSESPVISGGVKITGTWTIDGSITCGGSCTAYYIDLDANPAHQGHFNNFEALFFNGERRYRPYTTAGTQSYLTQGTPVCVATSSANCNMQGNCASGQYQCFDRVNRAGGDTLTTYHGMSNAGVGIHDVEMNIFENWTMSKLRMAPSNSDSNACTTSSTLACFTGKTTSSTAGVFGPMSGHRYLIENVKESLNQPGQWYLDRCRTDCTNGPQTTWRLTYLAKSGENPNTAAVYVPQIGQLIYATGLHHVTFSGLAFSHDNYVVPDAGQGAVSHASNIPAAVSCVNCSSVKFDSNTFAHTGNWALEFVGSPAAASATNNQVANNAFFDLGTGAVRLGQVPCTGSGTGCPNGADTDANVAQWNLVQNNLIRGGQRQLAGGIGLGVWIGNSHHNTVSNNTINDWYSGGIGVGAQLNYGPPSGLAHDNVISFNQIYDIGQGVTSDQGCLHTATSNQPGNQFLNNVCHDVTENPTGYGGHGIYLDQGSSNWTISNNLVYRVSDSTFFVNNPVGARNNSITNNIFAHGRKGLVRKNYDEPYQAFSMRHNIFYYAMGNGHGGVQYEGSRSQWFCQGGSCPNYFDFDYNLYFNADPANGLDQNAHGFFTTDGSSNFVPTWMDMAGWEHLGEDVHSVIQDPMFTMPMYEGGAGDDYSFKNSSGYSQIGFVPFSTSQAGIQAAVPAYPASIPAAYPLQLLDKDDDWGTIQLSNTAGAAQLPQVWVDSHKCDPPGGVYDREKTMPGDYAASYAGLNNFINDWAAAPDQWWRLKVTAGTVISGSTMFSIPAKATTTTKCAVVESSTPLTAGQIPCSHAFRDNADGTSPRNPGCSNDIGKMWTLEDTGAGSTAAIAFVPGSHHVVIRDAEIRPSASNTTAISPLIQMGSGTSSQNTLALVPDTIGLDRVYIHGTDSNNITRAIGMQCKNCWVTNFYTEGIHSDGVQSQVIGIFNTPGPGKIANGWSEGGSEGLFWGGSTAAIQDASGLAIMPADYEVRRVRVTLDPNDINKSAGGTVGCAPTGCPHPWNLANRIEVKGVKRILFDGLILEYSWKDAQVGSLQVINVRACSSGTNCTGNEHVTVEDVTWTNNISRHGAELQQGDGRSSGNSAGLSVGMPKQREYYNNNLAYDIVDYSKWGQAGSAHDMAVAISAGGNWFGPCTMSRNASGSASTISCTGLTNGGGFNGMTGMVVGDPVYVKSCSDTSFNTDPTTLGPAATAIVEGVGASAISVTYANAGTGNAGSGVTGCTLSNRQGWPRYTTWRHWTVAAKDAIRFAQETIGADNFPRDTDYTDNIAGSAGSKLSDSTYGWYCTGKTEGTPSEACWDTTSLKLHHNVFVRGAGVASRYTEYGGTNDGASPPVTLYFPTAMSCAGATPDATCIGFTGFMNGAAYPPADWINFDYHKFTLRTDSYYAAGHPGAASDGTSMGADIDGIDNAQTRTRYVCDSACGSGPYSD